MLERLCLYSSCIVLFSCASQMQPQSSQVDIEKLPIDGIWEGSFDINGKGPYDFHAIHVEGQSTAVSYKAKAMCSGNVNADNGNYFAHYDLYALDGAPFDSAKITGSLEGTRIESYFATLNGGDIGQLIMNYNPIYEQPSSLDLIEGQWSFVDRDGLEINVSMSDGSVLGNDSDGCTYQGEVGIINPNYNVYSVKMSISACDSVNGEYKGLSYLDDKYFRVDVTNERYGFHFDFEKDSNTLAEKSL